MGSKKKKSQRRSAKGGKAKAKKALGERASPEAVEDTRSLPMDSAFPEGEFPLQASEAVIGLSECPHKVKASSDRSLPPQHPAQSHSLDFTTIESIQIARINSEFAIMSDQNQQQEGPASEEPKSRSDAVTLLRARTASRSSLVESSELVDSPQSGASSLTGDDTQSVTASHTSVATTDSFSEPSKGKRKKNKSKKKYKKLDLATVAPNSSPHPHRRSSSTDGGHKSAQLAECQSQKKGDDLENVELSSVQSESTYNVESSSRIDDSKIVDYSAVVKGYSSQDKQIPQPENIPQIKSALIKEAKSGKEGRDTCNVPGYQSKPAKADKGKRRVARVDPVTGDEIPEEPRESSSMPTSSSAIANIEKGVKGISLDPSTNESSATATATLTPPSRSTQSSRRGSNVHMREKLSPIQETTGDADTDAKEFTPETRSLLTSTPKSSATIWSNLGPHATPQSERSATESDEAAHRGQGKSGKQKATPSGRSQSSHTHPESPARSERSTPAASSTRGGVSTQKPQGFFWQLDSHGFPCAKSGCDRRCNLWDGATVICPRCGPYSELRYCSKDHLLEDVKWHWLYCGQMTFEHPCRDSSIPRQVRDGPPMIPCIHPYDTPERHRQAVRFSMNARTGDYFIFSDWTDFVEAAFPENNLDVRCSHRVVYTVKFDDPEEKDRFRRVLAACLFLTIDVHELVDYLFRLIRDKLRSTGVAQGLEVVLKYQFQSEFNVTIQDVITGARHACETDWNGRNRRNCSDATCRAEFRRLLGSPPGRGHSHLLDYLEGNYWILRAARTTHPVISGTRARMRGDGFDEVADEDRRVFRRGEGWDGAGTGEMEIEDVNA